MGDEKYTILCVDDEQNILHSLRRLLRKEGYRLLTASSGPEGLDILKENNVQLVICDYRMPTMSGTKFLARVKNKYPDVIRIILTGYTGVDAITESINKGHVYKCFLKPWDDQSLKLEIKQALEQYSLIQVNKGLHEKVLEQNEELKKINENLETLVQKRTKELEIQNQALELSRAILEDLSVPIIGVSFEGTIVMINREAQSVSSRNNGIEIGKRILDYFPSELEEVLSTSFTKNKFQVLTGCQFSGVIYDIELTPLSGRFRGKGVVMALRPMKN